MIVNVKETDDLVRVQYDNIVLLYNTYSDTILYTNSRDSAEIPLEEIDASIKALKRLKSITE